MRQQRWRRRTGTGRTAYVYIAVILEKYIKNIYIQLNILKLRGDKVYEK